MKPTTHHIEMLPMQAGLISVLIGHALRDPALVASLSAETGIHADTSMATEAEYLRDMFADLVDAEPKGEKMLYGFCL